LFAAGDDDTDDDASDNGDADAGDEEAAATEVAATAAQTVSAGKSVDKSAATATVRKASKRSFYDSVELRDRRRRVLIDVAPWLQVARAQLRDDLATLKRSVRQVAARIGASRANAEASMAQVAELSDRYRRLAEGLRPPVAVFT
jgi:hypothetical protein